MRDFRPFRGAYDPRHVGQLDWGISVFRTFEQAHAKAVGVPGLGDFIVRLDVPDGVLVRRTGRGAGHHTIWAFEAEIATWAAEAMPVKYSERDGKARIRNLGRRQRKRR